MAINSLSASSKGFSGLVSGMDTESLVKNMLSGTQAKITKQKQNKAVLGYKQDTYRDILSSIKTFQSNYFSFGNNSSTNLLSSSFFNSMSATTKSTAYKVTGTTSASAGKVTVNSIKQLAQTLKLKSKAEASGKVEGKLDMSALEQDTEIQVRLDGVLKTIKLSPLDSTLSEAEKEAALQQQLQEGITKAFGNGINVSIASGNITFEATDKSREFIIAGSETAMKALGMTSGISNKINSNQRLKDINFASNLNSTDFKFAINGVDFNFNENQTLSDVISTINTSNAGVKIRYSSLEDKFSIESSVSGAGTKIEMSQTEGNLLTNMFGFAAGGDVTGSGLYQTTDFSVKIPGVPDDVTADSDALQKALDTLNSEVDRLAKAGTAFSLAIDGKEVKVTLPEKTDGSTYTAQDLVKAVNDTISGDAELKDKGVLLSLDEATGEVKLAANGGVQVKIGNGLSILGLKANETNVKEATASTTLESMGYGASNKLTMTIGGKSLAFDGTKTLAEVAAEMETALKAEVQSQGGDTAAVSVQFSDDKPPRFKVCGVPLPMAIEIRPPDNKLFAQDSFSVGGTGDVVNITGGGKIDPDNPQGPLIGEFGSITEGKNAQLVINGQAVERNSNEFTVEGLTFQLTATTNEASDVEVTRDTDKIFDGVVKFMDEYNKLIDKVWGLLKQDANYRDYPPLTDEQKKELSDKEIELWEEKAKEGLLRGDQTLEGIVDAMRSVLVNKPEGSKYSMSDIGLTTTYDFEKGYGGKLVFSDSAKDGQKLKEMIANEPAAIEKLFAGENGVMVQMNQLLSSVSKASVPTDKYAHLSLVDLAGAKGMPDNSSKIYKQMKDIDKNLEALANKYELEYTRYWKQFNAMEQTISSLNQQSSWLTQQMSS